jgi:hypothetical protein
MLLSRVTSKSIVACGAAFFLLIPASADAMIQINRGIAGARIGNSRTEVRAALGTPSRVRTGTNDFGSFIEYRFRGGIRVLFQGNTEVTSVSTTGRGDRTTRGVGVGSTERAVRRKVPGVTCETTGGFRSCHTGDFLPGQRITDFAIRHKRVTRVTVGRVID